MQSMDDALLRTPMASAAYSIFSDTFGRKPQAVFGVAAVDNMLSWCWRLQLLLLPAAGTAAMQHGSTVAGSWLS